MQIHDIQDVRFLKSVKDIFADGDSSRVDRFYQSPGKRYVCWEDSGWVHFKARREIKVPRTAILEMEPMTEAKRKELGPNPVAYPDDDAELEAATAPSKQPVKGPVK